MLYDLQFRQVPSIFAIGAFISLSLTSCSHQEQSPVVQACVKLGAMTAGPKSPSALSTCGCFDKAARRYLDATHYQALVRSAEISLAESGGARKSLIHRAVKDGATIRPGEFALAAADFLMLAHKYSDQCSSTGSGA